MDVNRKKVSGKSNRRRRGRRGPQTQRRGQVSNSLPSQPGLPGKYVKLPSLTAPILLEASGQIVNAAASFVVVETPLNGPSILGLSGGTGAYTNVVSGLADFTPYALGRVLRVSAKVNLNSFETVNDLSAVIFFSDTQPSTVITTYATAMSASTNYILSRSVLMGNANGMSRGGPMYLSATCRRILRDGMISFDRDFVAILNPVPAPPNQELWMGIIVLHALAAGTIAMGCSVRAEISLELHGFSRLPTS